MRSLFSAALMFSFTLGACTTNPDGADPGTGKNDQTDDPTTPDATPAPNKQGFVTLASFPLLGNSSAAGAIFGQDLIRAPIDAFGPCTLYGAFNSPQLVSAGTLEITGGTQPITLSPGAPVPGEYVPVNSATPLFTPGATLSIAAAGDEAPAFTAMVKVPTPAANVQFPPSLSRTTGASVTWTPGDASNVSVNVVTTNGSALTQVLRCQTTDTGSFQIPGEAVALLSPAQQIAIAFTHINEVTVTPTSEWTIFVDVGDGTTPVLTSIAVAP